MRYSVAESGPWFCGSGVWSCVLLLLGACDPAPSVPETEGPEADVWTLSFEPEGAVGESESVVAIHLAADAGRSAPDPLLLVEGTPSTVSLNRLEEGEITDVLMERVVPTTTQREPGRVVMRPHAPLAVGERYAVVSSAGLLGEFVVKPSGRPYLARLWPPVDSDKPIVQAVYCGSGIEETRSELVALHPDGLRGRWVPGLSSLEEPNPIGVGFCTRLEVDSFGTGKAQPPPDVAGFALDPAPFPLGVPEPVTADVACAAAESKVGPGCARTDGNRVVLRTPEARSWWVFSSSLGLHHETVEAGAVLIVPMSEELDGQTLAIAVFDEAGRSRTATFDVALGKAAPRLVINEVMANPSGAEPAQEWVELVNAGNASVVLDGFLLSDSAGSVALPVISMTPMSGVLLVREDFDEASPDDVPPAEGTLIVRLPQLGKGGLSNSGEALSLVDPAGEVVSRFPAVAATRQGISIARRNLYGSDDDRSGFGPHQEPGASPGAENHVE
jgi:hypothetical protein